MRFSQKPPQSVRRGPQRLMSRMLSSEHQGKENPSPLSLHSLRPSLRAAEKGSKRVGFSLLSSPLPPLVSSSLLSSFLCSLSSPLLLFSSESFSRRGSGRRMPGFALISDSRPKVQTTSTEQSRKEKTREKRGGGPLSKQYPLLLSREQGQQRAAQRARERERVRDGEVKKKDAKKGRAFVYVNGSFLKECFRFRN